MHNRAKSCRIRNVSATNKLVLDMEVITNDVIDIVEEVNKSKPKVEDVVEVEL